MRHGKAVRDHEARDDKSRGLTGRGRREAAEAGAVMAGLGLAPDRILVSSAARTRQTYEALAGSLPGKATFHDELYLAEPTQIWATGMACRAASVLVIGHNPGMHELALSLLEHSGAPPQAAFLAMRFPTSAFAAFTIAALSGGEMQTKLISAWAASD